MDKVCCGLAATVVVQQFQKFPAADHYLSHRADHTMTASRIAALDHIPKAAIVLCLLAVVLLPIGLFSEQDMILTAAGVLLTIGVLLALVYGLGSAPAAAKVVLWCMAMYAAGMIFKFLRFPGGGAMVVYAFTLPIVLFLVGTVALPFRYKKDLFLVLVGGISGLVLIVGYAAALCKMMYWPSGDLLFSLFAPVYVVVTIILLVGIQLADFVQWDPAPRRFLTNNILLPWAFLFLVGGSILLVPKQYFNLIGGERDWGMMKPEPNDGS